MRRDYGTGSVYQRTDGRWMGAIDIGFNTRGRRKRVTVSGKSATEVRRKLREKKALADTGAQIATTTVKQWAEAYLNLRADDLKPKAWNAAASPIRRWVVPTIGTRKLDRLTASDIRAVDQAQYDYGLKGSTVDATRRALHTMLKHAQAEGYHVPNPALMVKKPTVDTSDRTDLTLEESLACLAAVERLELPNGIRWALALLYGARQNEVLGLVEDCVDWETGDVRLEWQLQALRYKVKKRPEMGFHVPRGYRHRHLVDAWHLVEVKSKAGTRVLSGHPAVLVELARWREQRPANPWGLLFPRATGRPLNDKLDRSEWWRIQDEAGVRHPSGRYYHIHECRNFAATKLDEQGTDEQVVTSLLGHASIVTSRKYMSVHADRKRAAVAALASLLELGDAGQ